MKDRNDKIRLLINELKEEIHDAELENIFSSYIDNHPIHRVKKKFVFKDNSLIFAHKSLDLSKRDKIKKLLVALLDEKKLAVNKNDLILAVYGEHANKNHMSIRKSDCLNHNIVKLISRTRKLLAEHYGRAEMIWIPNEPAVGGWRLFSFRPPQ